MALEKVAAFTMRPLITHTLPLAQTAEAVKLAAQPTPQSLKVAVVQD